ncbi:hypothetical protein J26TS2_09040 [Shouchella clausii]|nr:hypothetical protein J26TS2_09040 [Shouchella clausii]
MANRASEYVMTYDHPVNDLTVFEFLIVIPGLDTLVGSGEYMYGDGDSKSWINKDSNKGLCKHPR